MRKAVPRGREEDGHFLAYLVKGLEHFFDRQPGIMLVDTHVKQSKFQLAHHLHAALEVTCGQQLVVEFAW